jgi:hypothetical protein
LKKNNLLKISFAAPILVSVLIASSPALASTSSSITVSTAQDAEVSAQVEAMGVDAGYEAQWGLQIIHANEVWSVSTGANVIVAVIDSGSGPNNDLQQNILPGRSIIRGRFSEGGNDVDSIGHGTHVAGIIAAQSDNDIGIAGVAPSAKILPIRVLDSNGDGSESDVALAIRFAIESGARVINLSLGGIGQSETLQSAIRLAAERNVLVVAAAGNAGPTAATTYPAGNDQTLAVTAVDQTMTAPSFTQRGSYIDISAPGTGICSTVRIGARIDSTRSCVSATEPYLTMNGTSMAAAFISGVAALIIAANPALTAIQVREVILATATDIGVPGRDDVFGAGLVNVYAIFRALGYLANETAYPTFSTLARIGVEIVASTLQLPKSERLQWYRCSSPGEATLTVPVDCVAIAQAQQLAYTPTLSDLGSFLRLGDLVTLGGTPQIRFSSSTMRVAGVWTSSSAIETGTNIAVKDLIRSVSRGKPSARIISGPCDLKKGSVIMFKQVGKCQIRISVSSVAKFPKLSSTVIVDVVEVAKI